MKNIQNLIKSKFKRAIVTGGAGFIGSHIAEELVKIGIEVISLDDYSAGKEKNIVHLQKYQNFTAVKCDITDLINLEKHFEGVDIIYHNAASKKNICLRDPRRDLEVNAKGTFNLLDLSVKYGVKKFIHASTGSVYGEARYFPQNEDHPLIPSSYYGVSKLAGEKYAMVYSKLFGLNVSVLRYFHVYGPRQESNEFGGVVSIFIRNMVNNEAPIIYGDGNQQRSFTYVKDVVKANLLLAVMDEANSEIYNCASGINVTINDLCHQVIQYFGKEGQIKPIYKDWLVGDIKVFEVSNAKLIEMGMNFEVDFSAKLKETIDEMRQYLIV